METHAAGARLPKVALRAPQARQLPPGLGAVRSPEEGRIFDPGVNRIRVGQGWFEMPDPLEFPRVLGAIIPLMGSRIALVVEVFADCFPSFAAVIRALNDLAKPAACLRGINSVWINRRTFEVIHFPACKMWAADF